MADDIALMGMKLTFDDKRIIRRYSMGIKEQYCCGVSGCTGCKNKCPKGVQVNEINRCLNYAVGYGDKELAQQNYNNLPDSNRLEVCSHCDECLVKCVNGLNLTENIRRAREIFA
jgi:predicted aldo/keto reductase-like oxidoreductase